ncbi:hypothetical protein DIRU0_E35388 [Diutina rugosa]
MGSRREVGSRKGVSGVVRVGERVNTSTWQRYSSSKGSGDSRRLMCSNATPLSAPWMSVIRGQAKEKKVGPCEKMRRGQFEVPVYS